MQFLMAVKKASFHQVVAVKKSVYFPVSGESGAEGSARPGTKGDTLLQTPAVMSHE